MRPFHITSAGIEVFRAGQIGMINTRSLDLSIDAINVERDIEIDSRLKRVMAVVKVRGSAHSNERRQFEITDGSIVIDDPVLGYERLLGRQPTQTPASGRVD